MLNILIYDERLSSIITEYLPFWEPFLSAGEFALCRWRPEAETLSDAVPELYETVGENGEWRAVVLYHGMAAIGSNPFDFFEGSESASEVEKNDLIRLTHMLSTVPHRVRIVARPEEGEETAPDGEYRDRDYILEKQLHFGSRYEDKDYYARGESNYEILCARPGKIILVATRRRDMSEEALRRKRRLQDGTDGPREGFADRNDYPANVRYLVYDAGYASETMSERDKFILMHGMMTLLMNDSSITLRPESVYRMEVTLDENLLKDWMLDYEERLYHIGVRMRAMQLYLQEEQESRRAYSSMPRFNEDYLVELAIDTPNSYVVPEEAFHLLKDRPDPDEKIWRQERAETMGSLAKMMKESMRRLRYSLDQIRNQVKKEEKPVTGRYSREQLEDAQMEMEQLERDMFNGDVITTAVLSEKEKDALERSVTAQVTTRMTGKIAFAGILFGLLVMAVGFVPYFVSAADDPAAMTEMLLFVLGLAGLFVLIWLIYLLVSRWKLRKEIRNYNEAVNKVVASYRALQQQYQAYVSKAFNYRRYWGFIHQLHEQDDKTFVDETAIAQVNLLRHAGALQRARDLCSHVCTVMGISGDPADYLQEEEPFTFTATPEESGYYELDYTPRPEPNRWAEDSLYFGYVFVTGFGVKREDWDV